MLVGAFGNFFSIVILFLEVHKAHEKHVNMNIIKQSERGPLPCSQVSEKSIKDLGKEIPGNISFNLAK